MDIEFYNQKRKELKLTMDDLAKQAGISRRTLTGILRQEPKYSNPTIDTIQKIERALGLSDITDEEAAAGVREFVVKNITADEDDLLEDYRELGRKKGADAQKAARDVVHALLL